MSGLRVPVFFGSILTLAVIVLQNRTPVFQLTLLGMRLQPVSLGLTVTGAFFSGLFIGAVLQRMGPRISTQRPTSPNGKASGFQPFGSMPSKTDEEDAFDFGDEFEAGNDPVEPNTQNKGWDTGVSSSWTERAAQAEAETRFWRQPQKPAKRSPQPGSVTPINRRSPTTQPENRLGSGSNNGIDESVVEAEYRIVTPYQRESDDEFDDAFFDDFFDEDSPKSP